MPSSDEVVGAAAETTLEGVLKRSLENFKGTFGYAKKVNDGNYGSDEYSIFVQFDFAPDADVEEFLTAAREAAFSAKSIVFEQAGLKGEIDASGVLHQVLETFPGATAVPLVVEGASVEVVETTATPTVGPNPPHDPAVLKTLPKGPDKTAKYKENSAWAEARFAVAPKEFWDNREDKRYPDSHDYAHKTHKGVGFWLQDART